MSDEETPLLPVTTSSPTNPFTVNEEVEEEEEEKEVDNHHNSQEHLDNQGHTTIDHQHQHNNHNNYGRNNDNKNNNRQSNYTTSSNDLVAASFTKDDLKNREKEGTHLSLISIKSSGSAKPFKKWYKGICIRQVAHSELAKKYSQLNMYMNTVSVACTALTSSAIFTSISPSASSAVDAALEYGNFNTDTDTNSTRSLLSSTSSSSSSSSATPLYMNLALFAGLISAFNTVLQGVMTTLDYCSKGEQHLAAFKAYTRIRFMLEDMVGEHQDFEYCTEHLNDDEIKKWVDKFAEIQEASPIIESCEFERIKNRMFG